MAAALLTLTGLSILGLLASLAIALGAVSIGESHVRIAVFATMLNLLAHSLMMFYLIGKGKAVREAVLENQLDPQFVQRVARARAPVFAHASWAMAFTMIAGFMGAALDAGGSPGESAGLSTMPHAITSGLAVGWQLRALLAEALALSGIGHIVDEVNARLAHG